ncbi:hypothetical protein E2C01_087294 [Portunus trituberculatus]|uniref:Uncharacterized protein n=1 Tax=Portunus trituberculatus TaxID=210409 RepID=A0A5B7JGX1_PORTR|nr:hypothetical protein [Portunus trituberculatus]
MYPPLVTLTNNPPTPWRPRNPPMAMLHPPCTMTQPQNIPHQNTTLRNTPHQTTTSRNIPHQNTTPRNTLHQDTMSQNTPHHPTTPHQPTSTQ